MDGRRTGFNYRPARRGKQNTAARAVNGGWGHGDPRVRWSGLRTVRSVATGKMKFVGRFYCRATLEVELHQDGICLKMFLAEDWISADREKRKRGRDCRTLDYTSGSDYVQPARLPARRELKGGVHDTYLLARIIGSPFNLDLGSKTGRPSPPPHWDIISASQHQEPKGPNSLNRCCVLMKKKRMAESPSVQLLPM